MRAVVRELDACYTGSMFVEALPEAPPPGDLARSLARSGAEGLAWLDGEVPRNRGWSFLAIDPVERVSTPVGAPLTDALHRIDERRRPASAVRQLDVSPPRWIGYLAYDAGFALHPKLRPRHHRDAGTCALYFARYDACVGFEHGSGRAFLFADDSDAAARLRARVAHPSEPVLGVTVSAATVPDASAHDGAVRAALAHIAAGDFYQVNLARRWTAKYSGSPLALFEAMRIASPVPLGAYLEAPDHAVLARTMETFLRWDPNSRVVETRPIKGTIPRQEGFDADAASTLRQDEKERAEHTMIVDLMRNDLARIAEVGSVRVISPFRVEPYARLSHLVTTVRASTRPEVGLPELIEATFPPGSVTGAPKLAAMQAIEDLEPEPRGVYCGAIGHVDHSGGVHLAVAIRTALMARGTAHYFAGGGLVSASDAAREVAETELKARVFLDALEALSRRSP